MSEFQPVYQDGNCHVSTFELGVSTFEGIPVKT